jgi:hypothetical protein
MLQNRTPKEYLELEVNKSFMEFFAYKAVAVLKKAYNCGRKLEINRKLF